MGYQMAVIGFGGMGAWHCDNLRKHTETGIEVTGAYDIQEEAYARIKDRGLKQYHSPEEIYEDKSIDLVLIATPNDVHMAYAEALLRAGKHVICEKPVALNSRELARVAAIAEETGKCFTVHQNRRWDSDFLTLKRILEDGLLHKPYIIESRVQGSRRALHGWRGYKQNGGGMVLDWGVHLVDQMLMLIDEKLVSVSAHLHNVFAPEVDDHFMALFRFESGLSYVIEIDMNCFIPQPRWHMACQDGTAVIENWELAGKVVRLADPNTLDFGEDIIYTAAGPTRSMAPRPKETTEELPLPIVRGEWGDYYNNIKDVLGGKADPMVTTKQAMRVMQTIDTIFLSQEKGMGIACEI